MPETGYIIAALAIMFGVTFALRALPFAILKPLRSSKLLRYLNRFMPVGILLILVVYTLKDVPLGQHPYGLPEGIAVAVTVGLHLWRRSAILSIVAGTAVYVVLINLVFT